MKNRHVILIGLRASGKSTLAPALASRLGIPSIDLDPLVAQVLGCGSVREAFESRGVDAFRAAEAKLLRELLESLTASVVSLGGGTPTAPGAAELLEAAAAGGAKVLYLRATPATLQARLSKTDLASRPSLTGAGTLEEVNHLFEQRDPLYRGLATDVIEVDALGLEELLRDVLAIIMH
jgi:shikimate kinase